MKNRNKIAGIALASLMAMTNQQTVAEEQTGAEIPLKPSPFGGKGEEILDPSGRASSPVAKQKIIDGLRSMKRNPEKIEFHSAMCYKVSMDPDTFDYSCPKCGNASTHPYHSQAGRLAREVASVRRSLKNLPTKVEMDETSLCSKCAQDKKVALRFKVACSECSKQISWSISNAAELEKLDWLFLRFPITSVDSGAGYSELKNPAKVKEMVEFISSHLFCPQCIEKLDLAYPQDKK